MQKVFNILCFIVAYVPFIAKAQPDSVLNVYANQYQEERIYIHFDKSSYLPGETIWFKAYFMQGIEPSNFSKNFYVEFANASGQVIHYFTAPIVFSSAKGMFALPNNFKESTLFVRAYTSWMLNFDSAFLYKKSIPIIQPTATKSSKTSNAISSIHFFPEGGYLINNLKSKVAFKATDAYGYPIKFKGALYNKLGKLIDSVKPTHNGMGYFYLTPQKGEIYTFKWVDELLNKQTTILPTSKDDGLVVQVKQQDQKLFFSVEKTATAKDNFKQIRIVATMHKNLVYRSNVKLLNNMAYNGEIPITNLPAGVLQITIFDMNWMPFAERICFIKNQENELLADARVFKPNLSAKAKNTLEINIPDEISANLSVAITDAESNAASKENILSSLFLTSDLKGYVHNPSAYFLNDLDSTNNNLDLVMLTNGWRRIKWDEVAASKMPTIQYPKDSTYLSIAGKLFGAKSAQIQDAGDINLIIKTKDSATSIVSLPLSKEGSFATKNQPFFDTVTIFYQFNKKKDLVYSTAINFSNLLLQPNTQITIDSLFKNTTALDTNGLFRKKQLWQNQQDLDKLLQTTTLAGVTVKAKQRRPVDELESKYASGLFKGGDGYQFDFINDIAAQSSMDIFTYLAGRVAGLLINNAGAQTTATWRGSPTSLFLNEAPVDASVLRDIQVADIAYVKVIRPPFIGASGGGAGGAIAVYTRRGADTRSVSGKGLENKKLAGYTFIKEFYAPNYEFNPDLKYDKDVRTTLYWNPFVLSDKKNRTIQITFFNNDISKKLRIDIQGMNEEGKLVSIQQLIQ
ncbi:MAG: hypothetical protein MUE72_00430 [Chitinophagaceae bacterium]|jgi:hypothetical protein|nr:hypothetical protein [Chitinophagaceae bacterium]